MTMNLLRMMLVEQVMGARVVNLSRMKKKKRMMILILTLNQNEIKPLVICLKRRI